VRILVISCLFYATGHDGLSGALEKLELELERVVVVLLSVNRQTISGNNPRDASHDPNRLSPRLSDAIFRPNTPGISGTAVESHFLSASAMAEYSRSWCA